MEYANLASYVYQHYENKADGTQLLDGWAVMTTEELRVMGVRPDMLQAMDENGVPLEANFAAVVLKKGNRIVISYRGSVGTPGFSHNWRSNEGQAFGWKTTEHNMAMDLAKQIKTNLAEGFTLSVTGHSLGGGLASAAAVVAECEGHTMNAAGLNVHTISRFMNCSVEKARKRMDEAAKKIFRTHTKTDFVTHFFYDMGMNAALGIPNVVEPAMAHRHKTTAFFGQSYFGIPKESQGAFHGSQGIGGVGLVMRPLVTVGNVIYTMGDAVSAFLVRPFVNMSKSYGNLCAENSEYFGPLLPEFEFPQHQFSPAPSKQWVVAEGYNRLLEGHDHKFLIEALSEDVDRRKKALNA